MNMKKNTFSLLLTLWWLIVRLQLGLVQLYYHTQQYTKAQDKYKNIKLQIWFSVCVSWVFSFATFLILDLPRVSLTLTHYKFSLFQSFPIQRIKEVRRSWSCVHVHPPLLILYIFPISRPPFLPLIFYHLLIPLI